MLVMTNNFVLSVVSLPSGLICFVGKEISMTKTPRLHRHVSRHNTGCPFRANTNVNQNMVECWEVPMVCEHAQSRKQTPRGCRGMFFFHHPTIHRFCMSKPSLGERYSAW